MENELRSRIFAIQSESDFQNLAMDIFRFQYQNNPVYKEYLDLLAIHPESIHSIEHIPFLPIQFFKSRKVYSSRREPVLEFHSSGTTGMTRSIHYVRDAGLYRESALNGFQLFYGDPSNFHFLALLPSYLEQKHSSLIWMVRTLISISGSGESGFYLNEPELLIKKIGQLRRSSNRRIMLLGVGYALLDLAEKFHPDLDGVIVLETGGMKGQRKEMVREEFYHVLCQNLNLETIHSEYGMTELLSQAYSHGGGRFRSPPWMKIMVRDIYNPFTFVAETRSGGINIMDLANLYSCPFIETQDLGSMHDDGTFEILGRFDQSDLRGCNLLVD
jgi:hypothetical protein